jgi:hypothetical protein
MQNAFQEPFSNEKRLYKLCEKNHIRSENGTGNQMQTPFVRVSSFLLILDGLLSGGFALHDLAGNKS